MSRTTRIPVLAALAALTLITLAAPRAWALDIKRMQLANGAVLLVSEQHQLPMVSMAIAFDAGSRRDPVGQEGIAALTASAMQQGTQQMGVGEFNQKVDFMGSAIDVSASRDFAIAAFTSLKKYQADTLHLLAETLQNPGLRNADIERKRLETIADIRSNEEEPGYTAGVAFAKMIFGDSPYGHQTEGSVESLGKLTPDQVRAFYHTYYKFGSAVIAVTGDVDADAIKASLDKEFSGLAGTVPAQAVPPAQAVAPGIHTNLINRNVAQANLMLGGGGIARDNPDYYKIEVMNYILGGGGFSSRLMKVVRSKAGLAYTIDSGFQAGKFPGAFVIELQTKNASANQSLKLILEQMREIQNAPVSDAELIAAKKYLIGSFPLKLDRQSEILGFMLQTEIYGLGLDYAARYPKIIAAVTKADVQQVARDYLHPNAIDIVAVANQGEAKIDVASFEAQKSASTATH